jgi:hypothetical protein
LRISLTILLVLLCLASFAQEAQPTKDSTITLPKGYLTALSAKASKLTGLLDRKTGKTLALFQKREQKMLRKLARTDPAKAAQLGKESAARYAALQQTLAGGSPSSSYNGSIDTASTSLGFLSQNQGLLPAGGAASLDKAKADLGKLRQSLGASEAVSAYLKERRSSLKESVGKLLPKDLKKLNKQAYYYSAQVNQYKALLKDKSKAEKKALELLTNSRAYKEFFRKNAELAKLFRLPGGTADPSTAVSMAGLQTRASVSQALTARFGADADVTRQLRDNLQAAQGQLNALKEKAVRLGSGSFGSGSDAEMPQGFRPNTQKTKSFLQRLEYGANVQNQKGSMLLPVTSDLGLSVGYKLNDKSAIGVGGSYKVGWGQGFRNLQLTSEGVGLRSYLDWKIKGALFFSGGYEMNFRSRFHSMEALKGYNDWQRSGLLGVSKKYKAGKKLKGDVKLLWDFLSYRQVPRTQAIVFRVGYSL